jgi:hypothetical protein
MLICPVNRLVKPSPLANHTAKNGDSSPLGLLDHDTLQRVVAYFCATEEAKAVSTQVRYVPNRGDSSGESNSDIEIDEYQADFGHYSAATRRMFQVHGWQGPSRFNM